MMVREFNYLITGPPKQAVAGGDVAVAIRTGRPRALQKMRREGKAQKIGIIARADAAAPNTGNPILPNVRVAGPQAEIRQRVSDRPRLTADRPARPLELVSGLRATRTRAAGHAANVPEHLGELHGQDELG